MWRLVSLAMLLCFLNGSVAASYCYPDYCQNVVILNVFLNISNPLSIGFFNFVTLVQTVHATLNRYFLNRYATFVYFLQTKLAAISGFQCLLTKAQRNEGKYVCNMQF